MSPTALRALVPLAVLAALAALAACDTATPGPVAGTGSPGPVTGSDAASPPPGGTAAPSSAGSPTPTRGAASATPAATRAACPVGAATLQQVSGLDSRTHRIDPDHIRCARQWASAGVIAVDPSQQGDGVLLFAHSAGGWKKIGEGSALECSPYGIPKEIGDQVGCRDHD
ncbi:hypothetical protein FJK98_24600 [Micromonospora sp. HM134]|uniref:hypothetical protein n=1 Tax=Micromonospora sp. HM134 TaxID=2583243 RepID=UPI00119878D0|nr:hypothetical protein [Micromonospora sp. HM134]QDY09939.1 hypothetical protein FJK98_24600 [Micromonospora sp. HM134]